jgi:hypothetical protein
LGRSGASPARNSASTRRSSLFPLACRFKSSSIRSRMEGSNQSRRLAGFRSEIVQLPIDGG